MTTKHQLLVVRNKQEHDDLFARNYHQHKGGFLHIKTFSNNPHSLPFQRRHKYTTDTGSLETSGMSSQSLRGADVV